MRKTGSPDECFWQAEAACVFTSCFQFRQCTRTPGPGPCPCVQGHESEAWLQRACRSLLSSSALEDWQRINPFLSESEARAWLGVATSSRRGDRRDAAVSAVGDRWAAGCGVTPKDLCTCGGGEATWRGWIASRTSWTWLEGCNYYTRILQL